MPFDEWFVDWKDALPFAPDEKHIRRLCDQCWQAAQKEAAKRCVEICDDSRHESEAADRIEREFGLDK